VKGNDMSSPDWRQKLKAAGKQAGAWATDVDGGSAKLDSALGRLSGRHKFPEATYVGTLRMTNAATRAVERILNPEEAPWLIIGGGAGEGCLVAFEDRLAIIKTGAITGLVAGSMGGERTTTIYFTDITGIEFNSGMLNGVLEVLTASYQGTSNKDFWRGTTDSRNADSNDPFVLSNTLPLLKSDYKKGAKAIQELRNRISKAKSRETTVIANVSMPAVPTSSADELKKFADLLTVGAISQEEYDTAKRRILETL
jgi:hypothetical protein